MKTTTRYHLTLIQILDDSTSVEVSKVVKFTETKSKWQLLGAGERGDGKLLFRGYRVSVLQNANVLGSVVVQCEYT